MAETSLVFPTTLPPPVGTVEEYEYSSSSSDDEDEPHDSSEESTISSNVSFPTSISEEEGGGAVGSLAELLDIDADQRRADLLSAENRQGGGAAASVDSQYVLDEHLKQRGLERATLESFVRDRYSPHDGKILRLMLMPNVSVKKGRAKGLVVVANEDTEARRVLNVADLVSGTSIYMVESGPQVNAAGHSRAMRKLVRETNALYDASLYHYHEDRHSAAMTLGAKNCSVTLARFISEEDMEHVRFALVVTTYHQPSSELLHELAQRRGVTLQQVFLSPEYQRARSMSRLNRDAIAHAVANAMDTHILGGAPYRASLLARNGTRQEVDAAVAYQHLEFNVMQRLHVEGTNAFAFYDHCYFLEQQMALVGMGRHEGYEWVGYQHAQRPQQRHHTIDPRTLYAFPMGYPSSPAAGNTSISERITWGSELRYHTKASPQRCLSLAKSISWHELCQRLGVKDAGYHRVSLFTQSCYISSKREDGLHLDTLVRHHPDEQVVRIPVTHPYTSKLLTLYAAHLVAQRNTLATQPASGLVPLQKLFPKQDSHYLYCDRAELANLQSVLQK